jgi:hypothetical protein
VFLSVQSAWETTFTPAGVTNHNDLAGLDGGTAGEYFHLTSARHTDLTDGGDSTLHFHATDRARANHTGTQNANTVLQTVETDSGTFTLALTDAETQQVIPYASRITVPLNSSVAFPTGTTIDLFSQTADPVSVVPATGVTIQGNQGLAGQYAMAHIRKIAADIWAMWGDIQQQAVYLLDKFTTPEAAPLTSPRTCEPGPGTLTILDTGNKLSISGGELISSGFTTAFSEPRFLSGDFERTPGLAYYARIDRKSSRLIHRVRPSAGGNRYDVDFSSSGVIVNDRGVNLSLEPAATECQVIIALRNTGWICFLNTGASWQTTWVSDFVIGSAALQVVPSNVNSPFSVTGLSVFQLYGDFLTDYGTATSHLPTPTSGDTATMTADGFVNFTWTPVAAESLELDIRRADDDNRWVIRCDQAGSTIKLIERNAGVETERASAAQTWTAGTAYTIQARAVGDDIRTFVDSVAKNTYTSATFNNTATGVKVAGFATGANLAAFPRTLTGAPADEIERQLTWLGL